MIFTQSYPPWSVTTTECSRSDYPKPIVNTASADITCRRRDRHRAHTPRSNPPLRLLVDQLKASTPANNIRSMLSQGHISPMPTLLSRILNHTLPMINMRPLPALLATSILHSRHPRGTIVGPDNNFLKRSNIRHSPAMPLVR